jgi:hypothetical protein
MFSSCPAQPVEDDLEQVPGSGIPFVRLEASQVADEEDDVPGADVGADGPFGLTGIEEQGQRFADRAQAVRGQGLRHVAVQEIAVDQVPALRAGLLEADGI